MNVDDGFTIRRLGRGDAAVLRTLNAFFAEVFDEPETYSDHPPETSYLVELLKGESFIAIVATEGENIVGGLVAYALRKFEQARSEIYIYDLGVAVHRRRRGIATALIEAVKLIAREMDAWVIFVQADRGDGPAIALYEKLGTREEVLHFDIAPG